MPDHIQYEDDDLFNPETHHESSDVPVRGLLWFIVIFIVFAIVTHVVILFLYKGFVKMERDRMEAPRTAVNRPASADVPQNQPLLQPFPRVDAEGRAIPPQADTPVVDMVRMREAEDRVLLHYGWIDKANGRVHIPIEEAKARFAAQAAVQGQLGGTPGAAAAPVRMPVTAPLAQPAPSGQPVTPDTGVAPSAVQGNATPAATTTAAATTTGGTRP